MLTLFFLAWGEIFRFTHNIHNISIVVPTWWTLHWNSRVYYPPFPRFPATSRIVRDPNLINPSDIRHVGSAPFRKRSENPLFFFQDFPPSKRFTVVMFWRSDVSRPFFACDKWLENFFFRLEKCRCTKDHAKNQVFVVCFLQQKNYFLRYFSLKSFTCRLLNLHHKKL